MANKKTEEKNVYLEETKVKKSRRKNGTGSIWKTKNGKWGLCVILQSKKNHPKIRYIEYRETEEEINERMIFCSST